MVRVNRLSARLGRHQRFLVYWIRRVPKWRNILLKRVAAACRIENVGRYPLMREIVDGPLVSRAKAPDIDRASASDLYEADARKN